MPIEAVLMAVILMLALAVLVCIGVIYRMGRAGWAVSPILDQRLLSIEGSVSRSDSTIREEFGRGRDETRDASRSLREAVSGQFRALSESVRGSIGDLATGQNTRLAAFAERLDGAKTRRQPMRRRSAKRSRGHCSAWAKTSATAPANSSLSRTRSSIVTQSVEQISQAQKERLDRVSIAVTELTQRTGEQQEALRTTVEQRLDAIRAENTEKLENIRQTVDEKLQSTLNERLGASFQVVLEQ
jgi:DNA recombination protein RmuC